MKLSREKDFGDFYWVAHPDNNTPTEVEKFLIENRYKIDVIGGITDNDSSYSYDDWALIKLKGKFYMLSTVGCSCPSPTETWRVEIGPATLNQIKKHILNGDYEGYTMPKKQEQDFIDLLEKAK